MCCIKCTCFTQQQTTGNKKARQVMAFCQRLTRRLLS